MNTLSNFTSGNGGLERGVICLSFAILARKRVKRKVCLSRVGVPDHYATSMNRLKF